MKKSLSMGKTPKRSLICKICKSAFPSYKTNSSNRSDKVSHGNHRSRNKACKEIQARLRRQHVEAGNNYDLDFENEEEMGFDVVEEIEDFSEDNSNDGNDSVGTDDRNEDGSKADIVFHDNDDRNNEFEDEDFVDENMKDDDSVHSSEDRYDELRRQEDIEYGFMDEDEHFENEDDEKDEEEKSEDDNRLAFHVAEAKRDPHNISYWANPQVDLIGVQVKKRFGNYGVYSGTIVTWKKPYFKVTYSDGDSEEYNLQEVLAMIDVNRLPRRHVEEKDAMEDDEVLDGVEHIDRGIADGGSDSDADSKSSRRSSNQGYKATVLTREECEMKNNDMLKVQLLVQELLYDQTTSPLRFNKVNDGKEVNKVAALQILQYCEERHMSRTEAEEYLKSQHKLIEVVTGKPFDMVRSYKTLKRVFLDTIDRKLPLSFFHIELPRQFFAKCRTRNNMPLPSLKAAHIPLEYAIGLLLLKLSPDDIIENMKAEYWRGPNVDGVETVERLYTNWCSSKFAVDIQDYVMEAWESEHQPIILYFSLFIDKGAMNASQNRTATIVSISLFYGFFHLLSEKNIEK